eukprot:m.78584 g.78584  ORF g.78584 m.78584 type:complete len:198 (-) comp12677_c0_seq4:2447-3040(-)
MKRFSFNLSDGAVSKKKKGTLSGRMFFDTAQDENVNSDTFVRAASLMRSQADMAPKSQTVTILVHNQNGPQIGLKSSEFGLIQLDPINRLRSVFSLQHTLVYVIEQEYLCAEGGKVYLLQGIDYGSNEQAKFWQEKLLEDCKQAYPQLEGNLIYGFASDSRRSTDNTTSKSPSSRAFSRLVTEMSSLAWDDDISNVG